MANKKCNIFLGANAALVRVRGGAALLKRKK